jgi:tetratricopeptide (TPR) repeat protein
MAVAAFAQAAAVPTVHADALVDETLEGCVDGGRFYSVAGKPGPPFVVYLHDVLSTKGGSVDLRAFEGRAVRLRGSLGPEDQVLLAPETPPEVTAEACPPARRVAILDYHDAFRALSPRESYERGLRQLEAGRYGPAAASFDAVIQREPGSALAYSKRGLAHAGNIEFKAALADCQRAIELGVRDSDQYALLCRVQRRLVQLDAALAACARAIELEPGRAAPYVERALVQVRRGDLRAALADYNTGLRLDPENEVVLANRARVLQDLGDPDAAYQDLQKALEIDPHLLPARKRLVEIEALRAGRSLASAPASLPPPPPMEPDEGAETTSAPAAASGPDTRVMLRLLRQLPYFKPASRSDPAVTRSTAMPEAKAPAWFIEVAWREGGEFRRGLALVASTSQPPPEGEWLATDGPWGIGAFEAGKNWDDLIAQLAEGRHAAWASVAQGRLRMVVRAQSEFAARVGGGRYAAELTCLVKPRACGFASDERFLDAGFLDQEWQGFRYLLHPGAGDAAPHRVRAYAVTAVAVDFGKEWPSYCADEGGRLCEVPTHLPFRIKDGACPTKCLPVN